MTALDVKPMTGTLLADAKTIECSDAVLAAIASNGGRAWIVDSTGCSTSADLTYDRLQQQYVLRAQWVISPDAQTRVEVRLRGARAA